MVKKKTKIKEEVSEQLVEIYKNKDGSLPNMSHFEKRKSSRTLRAFFVFLFSCLFLAAVVMAGIFFFKPHVNFSKDSVTVSVTGEDNITSGQVTHYRIRYHNGEDVPVTKAKILVNYPAGFIFKESSVPASNDKNNEWDLGTLKAQENGFIDVYGTLYGDLGAEESLRVFLNYTPANFSSEFQAVGVGKVSIGESPVALSITAPSTTVAGALTSIVFTLTVRDPSSSLQNLALIIDPGAGFTQKTTNPASDNFGAWTWTIPTLKGEKSITVTGAFAAAPELTDYTLKAKVVSTPIAGQQKTFILAQKDYHVSFEQNQFAPEFTINGASDALSVSPGDDLHVAFNIKNNSSTVLSNIRSSVTFDAPSFQDKSILNWAKIDDKNKNTITGMQVGTDIRRGLIAWENLTQIAFTLPVKSAAEAPLANFKENTIHATLSVQYTQDGVVHTFVSPPIDVTINSDFALHSNIEKQANAAGKDQFFVTWKIQNTAHEIQNAVLNAELYGDLDWQKDALSVSTGVLTFEPKEKKILWKAEKIPASSKPVEIKFSFLRKSYNPTQTQLISKIQLTGKDAVTGKDVIVFASATSNTP
ncbi:MAG: hypothetical protein A3B90_01030 [Candidatus Magasanikbacteria bacterium RIFCSPHIGHO2_02_FULL_41_13]|uniref:DUF11 domain-containing protein n=1 Tax=Candidatus Magasanikbacteria bacterium RIFCSPHIGHO2_02_FULL_41_13 TaxID=1798676 RepID=A0A1F6M4U6_9BACT|nr:MAG: hypothetical protein A3B90_01030 [Candidatus Magasanikbacteria bacterium RIFCSPHIGHO2_02_FULL_41_13]